jgi:hypothetical protein
MPADYYGGNKTLYVQALKASLPMYSSDGRMPDGGPETVLKVLTSFNPNIEGKHIDLSKTYTNEFVDRVKCGCGVFRPGHRCASRFVPGALKGLKCHSIRSL